MKPITILFLAIMCTSSTVFTQMTSDRIHISHDVELLRLSPTVYLHVSYADMPRWGRVASNGLIYVSAGEGVLLDTPTTDSLTQTLVQWIVDSLHVRIVGFVPNHWHNDCMGGLGYLKRKGIRSYAHVKTVAIARSKGLPIPDNSFEDSLTIHVGVDSIICNYFGAAHTVDNIVVWIPAERVLFGGCMVKDLRSSSPGNTADADLTAWSSTIAKVSAAFPDARIVVPGHGEAGNRGLLMHTRDVLRAAR